jgi:hypothetical protein
MTTFEVYIYGMVKACEARGVDPVEVIKTAAPFSTPEWEAKQRDADALTRGWNNLGRGISTAWNSASWRGAGHAREWQDKVQKRDTIGAGNDQIAVAMRDREFRENRAAQLRQLAELKKEPSTNSSSTSGSRIPGGDIFYDPQYGRASGRYEYAPTRPYMTPMTNLDGTPRPPPVQRPPVSPLPPAQPPAPAAPTPPAPVAPTPPAPAAPTPPTQLPKPVVR